MEDNNKQINGSPLKRRDFFKKMGTVLAGGSIAAVGIAGGSKVKGDEASVFWQIDPNVCTQCGRCETDCVMPVSAVRCVHAVKVCSDSG